MIDVSIVVPVYSGEMYLVDLMEHIDALRRDFETERAPLRVHEVIFVDDGAKDSSSAVIDLLAADYAYVTALHLSKNFGQHPATIAGILHSSGDWVATLDEDLQHPPARISDLFDVVARTGADVVYGQPAGGAHKSAMRDISSTLYKNIIRRLADNANILKVSSFRLVRGSVARGAAAVCAHDTYLDVAIGWFTGRIESISLDLVDHRYVDSGKSGYSLRSLLSHARRLAFTSHIKLLRLGAVTGMALLLLTILAAVALILLRLFSPSVAEAQGWTSLMLVICFFSGAIMFMIGILLEYASILVLRAHGKPLFFIADRSKDAILRQHIVEENE